jgi:hypothetical protein
MLWSGSAMAQSSSDIWYQHQTGLRRIVISADAFTEHNEKE